jgi:hypothetical protein
VVLNHFLGYFEDDRHDQDYGDQIKWPNTRAFICESKKISFAETFGCHTFLNFCLVQAQAQEN